MKEIPEIQVPLTLIEKKAILHCVRMAEAHIADWQFNNKRDKECVKTVRSFLKKVKTYENKD